MIEPFSSFFFKEASQCNDVFQQDHYFKTFFFSTNNRMHHPSESRPSTVGDTQETEEQQDFHKEQVAKARRTIQEHRARSLGFIFHQRQLRFFHTEIRTLPKL